VKNSSVLDKKKALQSYMEGDPTQQGWGRNELCCLIEAQRGVAGGTPKDVSPDMSIVCPEIIYNLVPNHLLELAFAGGGHELGFYKNHKINDL
jgi:hypothetical protein